MGQTGFQQPTQQQWIELVLECNKLRDEKYKLIKLCDILVDDIFATKYGIVRTEIYDGMKALGCFKNAR